ncbi:MAG TPA: hypothetical protein VK875_07435, partial [Euzebyales bacterium]|nr:hypothetical protein [Euzebyales bacterium]
MAEQRGASAIRAVIRQTLAQRRIPPHVVEYARQHLLQAWRFARRRLVDLTREPQRIAARR